MLPTPLPLLVKNCRNKGKFFAIVQYGHVEVE
jgi:hypothetical protein